MKHLWFIRNPHASLSPNEGVQWLCREVDQTLTGTRTGNNSIGITAGLIEAVLICRCFFRFRRWLVSCLRHNRYNPSFFASRYPFNHTIRLMRKIRKIAQVRNGVGWQLVAGTTCSVHGRVARKRRFAQKHGHAGE